MISLISPSEVKNPTSIAIGSFDGLHAGHRQLIKSVVEENQYTPTIASNARPSRGQTGKLIKRGLIVDLFGILFGLIGYQALMGALFCLLYTSDAADD